jgi:hypothetical protein
MQNCIQIEGLIQVDFFKDKKLVTDEEEQQAIMSKLQTGEYVFHLASKTISNVIDYSELLYTFMFDVSSAEYEYYIE